MHREVQMTLPPGSDAVLRELPGYDSFDGNTEVLDMLRGGFGLKDAPRLWQHMLQIVLERIGTVSLTAEPKLCVYRQDNNIRLIMSSHVDDLKGGGDDEIRDRVLRELEREFGEPKVQFEKFECIGIMHEQDPVSKEIWTHQKHYVKQLKPIATERYCVAKAEEPVSEATHVAFRLLLGAIAWLTLTMVAVCVYISALQRKSAKPTVKGVYDLNRLLKWIRAHEDELGIRYVRLEPPVRLIVVSDSAFRAQEHSGLAMRGCLIMLVSAQTDLPLQRPWKCVLIDWYSRRHTHTWFDRLTPRSYTPCWTV